jgi:hypothetical protein
VHFLAVFGRDGCGRRSCDSFLARGFTVSYTQQFGDSGWNFSMDLVADHLVAPFIRGLEVHELVTRDKTMLGLPEEGYQQKVTGRP